MCYISWATEVQKTWLEQSLEFKNDVGIFLGLYKNWKKKNLFGAIPSVPIHFGTPVGDPNTEGCLVKEIFMLHYVP